MDLLHQISKYLLAVETLTKEDIDEITETGKLARSDNDVILAPIEPSTTL
jgi:hypothetical protein